MFQISIHILQTDNGREYFSNDFTNFLVEHEIVHRSSCIYTPQQNGVVERKNRHLLKVARAMIFTSNVHHSIGGRLFSQLPI